MLFSKLALLGGSVSPLAGKCVAATLRTTVRALHPDSGNLASLPSSNASWTLLNLSASNVTNPAGIDGLLQNPPHIPQNSLSWPRDAPGWPMEIPESVVVPGTKGRWILYFVKKEGVPNPGNDWLMASRVLKEEAQRAAINSRTKPTAKIRAFDRSDARDPSRWNVAYSAELAEVRSTSWPMSNQKAFPIINYLAEVVSGYGHNLRSCRVTVFRLVDNARSFPVWPGKPYGEKQAFGGFQIQFYKVGIPRGGSSGSLPGGGGSSGSLPGGGGSTHGGIPRGGSSGFLPGGGGGSTLGGAGVTF